MLKKMLSSKHLNFNPSTFGLRDKNPSPAGISLACSFFFFFSLATRISFGFVLTSKSCQVTDVWQHEFKEEEKKKPTMVYLHSTLP